MKKIIRTIISIIIICLFTTGREGITADNTKQKHKAVIVLVKNSEHFSVTELDFLIMRELVTLLQHSQINYAHMISTSTREQGFLVVFKNSKTTIHQLYTNIKNIIEKNEKDLPGGSCDITVQLADMTGNPDQEKDSIEYGQEIIIKLKRKRIKSLNLSYNVILKNIRKHVKESSNTPKQNDIERLGQLLIPVNDKGDRISLNQLADLLVERNPQRIVKIYRNKNH